MADISRIKGNIEKMIGQNAPESDIDSYLASEGYNSADAWRSAMTPPKPFGERALDTAKSVASDVGDFAKRESDYIKTRTANVAGNIVGLPRLTTDAVGGALDWLGIPRSFASKISPTAGVLLGNSSLPTGQEISDTLKQQNKARGIETRNLNPILDAGVEGVMGGPLLGATGAAGPLINFAGGAGGEAAGQLAHEIAPSWETPARVLGSLVGGLSTAGLAQAPRLVKGAVQPFTKAGQDTIVGGALNRAASDAPRAVQALDSYQTGQQAFPSAVPGFRLNAGAASRDPGLMAVADTAPKSLTGPIVQENNAILHGALDRAGAGLPDPNAAGSIIQNQLGDTVNGLKAVRDIETKPLYDAARKSPTPLKPFPLMTYTADAVDANKGEPQRVMQQARSLLFTTDKNGRTIPDRSAKGMMATRDALNDMMGNQELGGHSRELLMGMKQRVDDALNAVPQARAANARYADLSKNLDPYNPDMGAFPRVLSKVVERDPYNKGYTTPDSQVPGMLMRGGIQSAPMVKSVLDASGGNPAIKNALASAYINDFKNTASAKVTEGLAGQPQLQAHPAASWLMKHTGGASQVLTPEQMSALRDITDHLKAQAQPVPARVGSQTFDRLGTQSVLRSAILNKLLDVPVLHAGKDWIGRAYAGADQAMMQRLYETIQDPAATATLMRKATPQNIKAADSVLRQITGSTLADVNQSSGRDAQ